MCNPRRVMIQVAEHIEEAFRRSVEETAQAEDEVAETARVTTAIRLREEMGDGALLMLERVLAGDFEGFEAWEHTDGVYRRELDQVTLFFDPSDSQLTVEARLAERVSAEARAVEEVSGVTIGEVAVEGIGNYYQDGWGGHTKDRAVQQAHADADRKMKDAVEALHLDHHGDQLDQAREKARARAQALAQEELEQHRAIAREALRAHLQKVLRDARDRINHIVNRAVGEAYRQTLLRLVRENGGRVLADETTGTVMNLEFVVP